MSQWISNTKEITTVNNFIRVLDDEGLSQEDMAMMNSANAAMSRAASQKLMAFCGELVVIKSGIPG
jgi:hypothetical protein